MAIRHGHRARSKRRSLEGNRPVKDLKREGQVGVEVEKDVPDKVGLILGVTRAGVSLAGPVVTKEAVEGVEENGDKKGKAGDMRLSRKVGADGIDLVVTETM